MAVETVRVGDLEIAHETFGDPADPPVLLVMGLATQMLAWPDEFCADLAGRGHHVIRFDNRDVGLSTHLNGAPPPDLAAALAGDTSSASYTLADMAADTIGLLDALGIYGAHLVGASMGGMIAQTVGIEHPDRVRSLTSIMSTTGDRAVGSAAAEAVQVLLAPAAVTREQAVERTLATMRVIGSPGYELDEAAVRDLAGRSYDRAHDPAGVLRQLLAIAASPDRTPRLGGIRVPAVVIHGADDPLIDVSGGRATAAAIPGSELVVIDGMGHDMPRALWSRIVGLIADVVERGERGP
jgi:pimeloyl-ACP methyl ester carboxylesterase